MVAKETSARARRRAKPPLERESLRELALAYVARYATSRAKLRRYLKRKVFERGFARVDGGGTAETDDGFDGSGDYATDQAEIDREVDALVERMAELGFVDDRAFATMKAASLARRGYGARRIAQSLAEAGIAGETRARALPDAAAARHAALALARRRRFGPFGRAARDPSLREKQIAAMLRAGHDFDSARALVEAGDVIQAERWAHELDDDED